jgi:CrcB protein
MSAVVVLGVGVLGGLGAVARLLLDGAISRRSRSAFAWGILAVNLSGTLALGVLVGAAVHGDAQRLLAGGLLGAYTTFSTWMLQSRRIAEEGRPGLAALNLVAGLALGIAAVWLGRELGAAL